MGANRDSRLRNLGRWPEKRKAENAILRTVLNDFLPLPSGAQLIASCERAWPDSEPLICAPLLLLRA